VRVCCEFYTVTRISVNVCASPMLFLVSFPARLALTFLYDPIDGMGLAIGFESFPESADESAHIYSLSQL
jgi:hypothetical protein